MTTKAEKRWRELEHHSENQLREMVIQCEASLDRAHKKVARLRSALRALVDDVPCRLDHEGYCQSHGVSKPCVVDEARRLLRGGT